jgi:hypothetical protein
MRRMIVSLLLVLAASGQLCQAAGQRVGEEPGANIEMPFLIAPMSKDGKLLGYTYISSKMVATSQRAAIDIRDKLAFIQDTFVRDVNAAPIGKADDPKAVDTNLLNQRLVADTSRIMGPGKVDRMLFMAIQFAPLHPGASTDNLVPPTERAPDPAATNATQGKAPDSPQSSAAQKSSPLPPH